MLVKRPMRSVVISAWRSCSLTGTLLRPNWLNSAPVRRLPRGRRSALLQETLFLGGPGCVTPLHADGLATGALLAQVHGEKRCLLFAPEQEPLLHPERLPLVFGRSPIDVRRPDLERFPRFAAARPVKCTLRPGDLLYIPSRWWHAVQSTTATVSYSLQVLNGGNAAAAMRGWAQQRVQARRNARAGA
jgi:hypothetical protein